MKFIKVLVTFFSIAFLVYLYFFMKPQENLSEVVISDFNGYPCFYYSESAVKNFPERSVNEIQVIDADGVMQWHVVLTTPMRLNEKLKCLRYGVDDGVNIIHVATDIKTDRAYGVAIGSGDDGNSSFELGYFCKLQGRGIIIQISSAAALKTPFKCLSTDELD